MSRLIPPAIAAIVLCLLAYSCATTSGGTLQKAVSIEAGAAPGESSPTHPAPAPAVKRGLTIQTTPDNASVYLNGVYQGTTPLVIENLSRGSYLLMIRKEGYYDLVTWVDFPGDALLFQATLNLITGFLQLSATPPESIITIGGSRVYPGLLELPVGRYRVTARAFGFGDQSFEVDIQPKAVTPLDVSLSQVPFSITRLTAAKSAFNPDNPGILGTLTLGISVSGPGSARLTVSDPASGVVFEDEVGPFTTWDYTYTWSARDSGGGEIPDGEYTITLSGEGADAQASSRDLVVRIDRSVRESLRAVWSGGAGLTYVSSTDILPRESFQASFLGAATVTPSVVRVPAAASARLGIGGILEVDAEVWGIFSDLSVPIGVSASVRYPLARMGGRASASPVGFDLALEGKASLQYNPAASGVLTTDTLSNFSGLSVGFPMQGSLGPVSLCVEPQIIASWWQPYDESIPPVPGFSSWLYLRGGILVDAGPVSGGISAAVRTTPFGVGAFAFALPFQIAAEAHWLVPGSHLVLSALVIGEVDSASSFYLAGGGGLGFIY